MFQSAPAYDPASQPAGEDGMSLLSCFVLGHKATQAGKAFGSQMAAETETGGDKATEKTVAEDTAS